jgi:transcriptional regulator with XRE-family HTH domain
VYFGHSARVPLTPQRAFGQRVRELRLAAGMTQEDLAERCGLFRTYMSRIETGQANPTLTMIQALADSLELPVLSFFDKPAVPTRSSRLSSSTVSKTTARPSRGRVR